jgi:hypothetical protein
MEPRRRGSVNPEKKLLLPSLALLRRLRRYGLLQQMRSADSAHRLIPRSAIRPFQRGGAFFLCDPSADPFDGGERAGPYPAFGVIVGGCILITAVRTHVAANTQHDHAKYVTFCDYNLRGGHAVWCAPAQRRDGTCRRRLEGACAFGRARSYFPAHRKAAKKKPTRSSPRHRMVGVARRSH